MGSWIHLPREILVYIFRSYLTTENQENLLCNIAPVCQEWKNACMNSYLWRTFDGSLTLSKLKQFSSKGYLKQTEILHFSQCEKNLLVDEYNKIFSGLPNLKYINVNQIEKSRKNVFQSLINHCFSLCEIDFSGPNQTNINLSVLEEFLLIRGSKLIMIDFSNTYIGSACATLKKIADSCPNLQQLLLLNIPTLVNFPLHHFQTKCSHLKVLRMGPCVKIEKLKKGTSLHGFPELEVFSFVTETGGPGDDELGLILFNSTKLKFLELRGCSYLNVGSLLQLPTNILENFFLTKSKICDSKDIFKLFTKWHHSLKVVDISGTRGQFINEAILGLLPPECKSCLCEINLSGTQVSACTVKKLIEWCDDLEVLHLESCRELMRGIKRVFRGKSELQCLLNKL